MVKVASYTSQQTQGEYIINKKIIKNKNKKCPMWDSNPCFDLFFKVVRFWFEVAFFPFDVEVKYFEVEIFCFTEVNFVFTVVNFVSGSTKIDGFFFQVTKNYI